jgi:predicted phage terminase large subunit-like protein
VAGSNAKAGRRAQAADLLAFAASLRSRIEAEVAGFDHDAAASGQRRRLAMADLQHFARTYFPHYVTQPNSLLHDYLYRRLQEIAESDQSEAEAIAAPRGEAKSTITSQIFVLWCVATQRKWYVMIGMDAFDQAALMLEAIKAELESNPRLAMDFPELTGRGPVWQAGVIVTRTGRKIEAAGSAKRIRGRRHGSHRPDLFVGDDLENDENVRTPEQRDKIEGWIKRAVLKLGGAGEKFDCIIIGTILHYDSVLARLLANPLWTGRKFKAMIRWPDNMALWDVWENLLLSQGEDAANLYYAEHRNAMDAGAQVSWPACRPLVALMRLRARDGHAAFDSEFQNDPLSDEDAPFAAAIHFWVDRLKEWVFLGACDPSLGRAGASRDPSAILVGGHNRETGILDVVEALIAKRLPDRIIEDIISLQAEYRCALWLIEAVQFQAFLYSELVKRSAQRGIPVPGRAVTPIADKVLRIEALQPHMANGLIRLHPSQSTLIDQLRHFPKADHDDGPDALAMLWMGATTMTGGSAGFVSLPRARWQMSGLMDRDAGTPERGAASLSRRFI